MVKLLNGMELLPAGMLIMWNQEDNGKIKKRINDSERLGFVFHM